MGYVVHIIDGGRDIGGFTGLRHNGFHKISEIEFLAIYGTLKSLRRIINGDSESMCDTLFFGDVVFFSLFRSRFLHPAREKFTDRSNQKQKRGYDEKKDDHKIVLFSFLVRHHVASLLKNRSALPTAKGVESIDL